MPYAQRRERMMEVPTWLPNMRPDEVGNKCSRNVVRVYGGPSGTAMSGLFVMKDILMVPQHFFEENEGTLWTYIRTELVGPKIPGNAQRSARIDKSCHFQPENTDVCFVVFPSDDFKDLSDQFCIDPLYDVTLGSLITRDKSGVLRRVPCSNVKFKTHLHSSVDTPWTYKGYDYTSENYPGLCGAPLIDTGRKNSSILGIHVAGNPGEKYGVSVGVFKHHIDEAKTRFGKTRAVVKQSAPVVISKGVVISKPGCHYLSPAFRSGDDHQKVRIIGSVENRHFPKSDLIYTPIRKEVCEAFGVPPGKASEPSPLRGPNNNYKNYGIHLCYTHLGKAKSAVPAAAVSYAVSSYKRKILNLLESNPDFFKRMIRPLNDDEVINGTGQMYMNGMPMTTAAGYEFGGDKRDHFDQLEDGRYVAKSYVMDSYRKKKKDMQSGKRCNMLFFAYSKDEGLPKEKVDDGKLRTFFASNTTDQMIFRQLTLSVQRLFCTQSATTECAVGTNPQGPRWADLVDYLTTGNGFTKKKFMAIDFSKFDLNVDARTYAAAFDIIIMICEWSGNYSDKDLIALEVLKEECMCSYVNMNGDLCQFLYVILSGINLTSILGCIVNSLYIREAYYHIYAGTHALTKDFHDVCKNMNYGDDFVGNVHKSYPEFNMENIIKVWGAWGIKATNCFKTDDVVKYLDMSEVDFIKRKFRYDKDFGSWVAPLDKYSLLKPLTIVHRPKTCSLEKLLGDNVDCVLFEMKFWGRSVYDDWRQRLYNILQETNLLHISRLINVSFDEMVLLWKLKYDSTYKADYATLRWINDIKDLDIPNHEFLESSRFDLTNSFVVSCQSSRRGAVMTFVEDEEENDTLSIPTSMPSPLASDEQNTSLSDFFSRPVRLSVTEWSSGYTTLALNPWTAFFHNRRVANRLSNFNLMRCKLHLKFTINGNSFFYGRMMVVYRPLPTSDGLDTTVINNNLRRVSRSQMPRVMLDPATSKGGEMILPFFFFFDYACVTVDELPQLGSIEFHELNPLKQANSVNAASLSPVTITTFAWAEGIEIRAPTQANAFATTPQSEKEEDQTTSKPISQAATAIADAAGLLSTVPGVGSYARPVEMGARAVSKVADALGYCRPTDVREPAKYTPRAMGSCAVGNTSDSVAKLSFDVKQQLTIDAASCFYGSNDEMSISKIAGRESYWFTFPWDYTHQNTTRLANFLVTPMACRQDQASGQVALTAVAGATYPFRLWTGSIIYRFQIVCSSYHKGRLAIVYDPRLIVGPSYESNVAFTEIVDISKVREFELTVDVHQSRCWLGHNHAATENFAISTSLVPVGTTDNGGVAIYVLNELTLPNYDATVDRDISVNVFIRGGEDYRVQVPGNDTNRVHVKPQSEKLGVAGEVTGQATDYGATASNTHVVNQPVTNSVLYMGEAIDDLRLIMKRYLPFRVMGFLSSDSTQADTLQEAFTSFPCYRGEYAGGLDFSNATPPTSVTYAGWTYLNWYRMAFAGSRGGVRYKLVPLDDSAIGSVFVTRSADIPSAVTRRIFDTPASSASNLAHNILSEWLEVMTMGADLNVTKVNNSLEFEVPYLSPYRFLANRIANQASFATTTFGDRNPTFRVTVRREGNSLPKYVLWSAAGEDISLVFFIGFPVLNFGPMPTPAT